MLLDAEALASLTAARSTFRPDLLELFAERRSMSAMVFRDGGITNATSGREGGVGVRVRHGSSTVHSVSDQLTGEAVRDAVTSAMSLCARQAPAARTVGEARPCTSAAARDLAAEQCDGPGSDDRARQAALLYAVGDAVTGPNGVSSVTAILRTEQRVRDIADSDGGRVSCRTRRERVAVTVTVGPAEAPIRGRASVAVNGPETELTEENVRTAAAEAIRRARSRLKAVPAPTGEMPVVLAPGSGAVLIHEALGHGLEADHLSRRSSAFHDLLGRRIGPAGLTIVDDRRRRADRDQQRVHGGARPVRAGPGQGGNRGDTVAPRQPQFPARAPTAAGDPWTTGHGSVPACRQRHDQPGGRIPESSSRDRAARHHRRGGRAEPDRQPNGPDGVRCRTIRLRGPGHPLEPTDRAGPDRGPTPRRRRG